VDVLSGLDVDEVEDRSRGAHFLADAWRCLLLAG
jgi:hypothetical protein